MIQNVSLKTALLKEGITDNLSKKFQKVPVKKI